MIESGNYPMGAENDPDAPWNQVDNSPEQFEVEAVYTLTKRDCVNTRSYYCIDEDIDTSYVDWEEEWNNQHNSVLDLLSMLSERLLKELNEVEKDDSLIPETKKKKIRRLKFLLSECDGWEEEYSEFNEV